MGGEDGVAAQVKEAVAPVHGGGGQAQEVSPNVTHRLQGGGGRLRPRVRVAVADHPLLLLLLPDERRARSGKGALVHLPVRRKREVGQKDDDGGDGVGGEGGAQLLLHLDPRHAALPDDVGDEHGLSLRIAAHQGHAGPDVGEAGELGVDLAQLDAEATHLALVIGAPHALHAPVRQVAPKIPGPVQPVPRPVGQGDRIPLLGGGLVRPHAPRREQEEVGEELVG